MEECWVCGKAPNDNKLTHSGRCITCQSRRDTGWPAGHKRLGFVRNEVDDLLYPIRYDNIYKTIII